MSAEPWRLLRDANEVRVAALEEKAGGQASLENTFDVLRILLFLDAITINLGIFDATLEHFEEARADMLTKMEDRFAQMVAALEAAERQAQFTQPFTPNRQQRRHPGPQGIVRP